MDKNEVTRQKLKELGITAEDLIALLLNDVPAKEKPATAEENLEVKVEKLLHRLGGPAHIKGYNYAADAIMMAVENRSLVDGITKVLYPAVAKKYDTTPSRVERAIRHFIETSWDRCDWDTLAEVFGSTVSPTKGKPTNSEFIALLADHIRMGGK